MIWKTLGMMLDECIQRGGTFGSLLRVTLNLIVREVDEETGVSSVKDIKEQDVYLVTCH